MLPSDRILVVDDSQTVRQLLKLMLRTEGYVVEMAATGDEATSLHSRLPFDLALVDINLQEEDGFALCRALRQRHEHMELILITGDRSVESAIRAVGEDIAAYLTKPFSRQEVLDHVRRALDRVKLVRERAEALAGLEMANQVLELRTAELERTLEQLLRAQTRLAETEKLVSLGMLAAGVAHEINNPACFILPNLEYIKRAARELGQQAVGAGANEEEIKRQMVHIGRMLDRCLEGVERIRKVVGTLQLFSRVDREEARPVDLNALCLSLLDVVSHELGGRVRLEVELAPAPPILGHQRELAQAVLNLLHNARRSVLAGPADMEHEIRVQTLMETDRLVLSVTDSGAPLATSQTGQVLDPFYFDATDPDRGPGLSLSLARDILQRHGGRLTLYSHPGGNKLEASLPLPPNATRP